MGVADSKSLPLKNKFITVLTTRYAAVPKNRLEGREERQNVLVLSARTLFSAIQYIINFFDARTVK